MTSMKATPSTFCVVLQHFKEQSLLRYKYFENMLETILYFLKEREMTL